MKNSFRIQLAILSVTIYLCLSCQSKEGTIDEKNECYQRKMNLSSTSKIYRKAFTAFSDTVIYIQKNKNFFNENYEDLKIDDALFFKGDSLQCLAVVLSRNKNNDLVFGHARTFFGKVDGNNWKFKIGLQLSFDADYFKLYSTNNFDNLSKLVRHHILTYGHKPKGCGIDESYWFEDLLKE